MTGVQTCALPISGDYDRKKKKFQSSIWRVGSGDYNRKKKSSSGLSGALCCCGSGYYNRKKKVLVVCLAGCQFLVLAITTGKKKSSSRLSDRLVLAITTGKKKVPVVCLAGCAVVVLAITTGKKWSFITT